MLKVCLLGYGGIGRVHRNAYEQLEKEGKAKLVGVCDTDPDCFTKEIAINISDDKKVSLLQFNAYHDLDEMLEKEKPDMVDICLPTFMHKEKSIALLNAGYHVMCEKPMALTYRDCLEMLNAAKAAGRELMIGQCLHFFPEYEYLKDLVDSRYYGKPLSAFFQRLSPPPRWGWNNWYMNSARSGDCIQDMHIHDLDMARYLFGEPNYVACCARNGFTKWDSAHSTLWFENLTATVVGDWSMPNFPFEASYRVTFEGATIVCRSGEVTVYPVEGEGGFVPDIKKKDGYTEEIGYFVDLLNSGTKNTKNTPESAARSVKLVETLKESALQNGKQVGFSV